MPINWDDNGEVCQAWKALIKKAELDGELDPVEVLEDALDQLTLADMLELFPQGFAIGPGAGLYSIAGTGPYNRVKDEGILFTKNVFHPSDIAEGRGQRPRRTRHGRQLV